VGSNLPLEILAELGEGGQGVVYLARHGGQQVALKLYHEHAAKQEQRQLLEKLVERGAPMDTFLWPEALVDRKDRRAFGYLMPLREDRFRRIEDFMARRVTPSFRALLTSAIGLAQGFLKLHTQGFCYRDISFGNVFFDPDNGEIRICDNDNVDIPGAPVGVLGTPRFMAPEVVRGEVMPSDRTDRFSLAVLLFYLLQGGHPLDGAREAKIRCLDASAMSKLYGEEPIYIFDPTDDSNRPVPGIHDNPIAFEPIYPTSIRELFQKSFTDGLHLPDQRVMESEWRAAFVAARDAIFPCSGCGLENIFDLQLARENKTQACWRCHRNASPSARLKTDDALVVLSPDTKLYEHHLGLNRWGFKKAQAEVTPHQSQPGLYGLRNLSGDTWELTLPGRQPVPVPPGKAASIADGNILNFGRVRGEMRVR